MPSLIGIYKVVWKEKIRMPSINPRPPPNESSIVEYTRIYFSSALAIRNFSKSNLGSSGSVITIADWSIIRPSLFQHCWLYVRPLAPAGAFFLAHSALAFAINDSLCLYSRSCSACLAWALSVDW